jgi:hypothetical protein
MYLGNQGIWCFYWLDLVIRTEVLPVAARNASTAAPTRSLSTTDLNVLFLLLTVTTVKGVAVTETESMMGHQACSLMGSLR